jgi:Icc-related predicted phosphoesterase
MDTGDKLAFIGDIIMKILAMADLHGDLRIYRRLKKLVASHDAQVVVLAGDLLRASRSDLTIEEAQAEDARQIVKILKSLTIPVLYIMGNDDLVELGYEDSHIHAIHGKRIIFGNYGFVGYQYSLPFVLGRYEKPENEIEKDLLTIEPLLEGNTIFVTHSPAYGILDEGIPIPTRDIHVGSKSILELVRRRPIKAHVHGHIHKCFGHSGMHFNVAAGGHFRGMIINLEDLSCEIFDHEVTTRL